MNSHWLRAARAPLMLCSSALCLLPGCGMGLGSPSGGWGSLSMTCSELSSDGQSQFAWTLDGFAEADILDTNSQLTALTALLHVTESKTLKLHFSSAFATEDCMSTVRSVVWVVAEPAVAQLGAAPGARSVTLTGLRPGDTEVFADVAFNDGTPTLRLHPKAQAYGAPIMVVSVIP